MACDKIKILLSAYLDGELNPSETKKVEQHLKECKACQLDLEKLKSYLQISKEVPSLRAPVEIGEAIWESVKNEEDRTPLLAKIIRRKDFQLISSFAAAALIILYVAFSPNLLNTSNLEGNFAYQQIKRGKGPGEKKGSMTDGSKEVTLLKTITLDLNGEVLEESYNVHTGMTDYLTVRIKRKDYPFFKSSLDEASVDADLPESVKGLSRYVAIQLYFPGRKFIVGDFNGDGRSDIATYFRRGKNTGQWFVSYHEKEAKFLTPLEMKMGDSTFFIKEFAVPLSADLNGDSLFDLLIANPSGDWQAFINEGAERFRDHRLLIDKTAMPSVTDLYAPRTGDFNADGFDDIAIHYLKGNFAGRWYISLNDQASGFNNFKEYVILGNGTIDSDRYFPLCLDFNADGHEDCLTYWQSGELNASWLLGLNNHHEKFEEPLRVYFGNSPLAFQGDYYPFTGDFNGDGYDDLLVKSGTQDEKGEWYLEFNEAGNKFTYGFSVIFDGKPDFTLE
jgi:hypothetical protein